MSAGLRVAMDIGGTFTDLVAYDPATGTYQTGKVATTPGRLQVGVVRGLTELVDDLATLGFLVHGTTAGLNAFLERKGARVALVTTEGFRDVYEIARGNRPEMYNVRYRKPKPLVPRRDVYEVPERLRYDGTVLRPLRPEDLRPLVAALRAGGYEAVAICLLHAHVNPVHEQLVRDVIRRELPGLTISCSHEVAREWREYERTSTTVINAYIAPIVSRYLGALEEELRGRGLREPLYIMRSNGGIMTADVAREQPIQTLLSGPVGGAVGTALIGRILDRANLIGVDMGGTSFDVTLVIGGQVDVTNEATLEGFPILSPMVNIHTIGAGGGSLAWVEAGGLRVGPQSAGAEPGPACYGRGGTEPTVTDANAVLGRLDPERFLGGRMSLDVPAAREAVGRLAARLGLGVEEAAEGILAVVNHKMADAIRTLTVRKGIDPREFALVAFGGAGPMHAAWIAEVLEIDTIIVPNFPGAFSAWGMLQTDIRHDAVRTYLRAVNQVDPAEAEGLYREMEGELAGILARQHVAGADMVFLRTVDMRYVGQEYLLNLPLSPAGDRIGPDDVAALVAAFHERHRSVYGHASERTPVEIVNLRVTGLGRIAPPPPAPRAGRAEGAPAPRQVRPVVFGGRSHPTPVYERDTLQPGHRFTGPAIVTELTTTTVIPPGWAASVDGFGHLILSARGV